MFLNDAYQTVQLDFWTKNPFLPFGKPLHQTKKHWCFLQDGNRVLPLTRHLHDN